MKRIVILGSTGSIGTQTLQVVSQHQEDFEVVALMGNSNVELLNQQIKSFKPKHVGLANSDLQDKVITNKGVKRYIGEEAILEMITNVECDVVVIAISGAAGLKPAITAINAGRNVALATKEVMVLAGELVNILLKKKNLELVKQGKQPVSLFPIDSEHSAIWQSLQSGKNDEIEKIILTCSGGPFRGKARADLETVTIEQALNHPNWNMGKRITIDSATLFNKGLEVIEAKWLFEVDVNDIEVVVHPQSILHSAVQFRDGSIIGQFGAPDMRIAIQYSLTYPDRPANDFKRISLTDIGSLTFLKPDIETFPCLGLAYEAIKKGGTMPTVLNAADEVAVSLFLQNKIRFVEIPKLISEILENHTNILKPTLGEIIEADLWAREKILKFKREVENFTFLNSV